MLNANLLAESRYLESKGLIKEGEDFGTGENFGRESAAQEYAMKSGENMYNGQPDLNKEINASEDNLNDPLFSHGVHFKSEYAMKGIPRPTIIIPFAIEGQKTIWYRHKDDKKKKEHTMSLDMFLNYYELKSKYK
jgi:hypothetical protein